MDDKKHTINVSFTNRTIMRIVVVIVATLLGLMFFDRVANVLQLILIAFFLSLALNPAVSWISRHLKSKSRVRATAVAYLAVILIIAGFLFVVIPPFVRQTVDFVQSIPTSVEDLNDQDTALVRFIKEKNLTDVYTNALTNVKNNLQNATSQVFTTATTVGGTLVSVVAVLVMTFMMLIEGPVWLDRLWRLQPKDKLEKRKRTLIKMYTMVTGYVNGQLLLASIAAIFALIAMLIASSIFDASINAVAMAFVVGMIGLIPMIGNTIAAVIVVLVCAFVSIPLAITMAVFFLVYQQVENATLQPYIQAKYNALTPLTVFVAALLGIGFAGFLGALVAIPVAGCIRIYFLEYYGHKLAHQTSKK